MNIEMIEIPGGDFQMGSNLYEDSQPIHTVTVAPFSMGKYPITQAQWREVMGDEIKPYFQGDDLPMESLSWHDAQEFCARLSAMTGEHYRLPTEAEREYACCAGSDGDRVPSLDEGWFWENSNDKTHPVGQKQPNAFGLYDMHGNVWEWCQDVWHNNYNNAPTDGGAWEGESIYFVLRGGSWAGDLIYARAVYRSIDHPAFRTISIGFRVACSVCPPSSLDTDTA